MSKSREALKIIKSLNYASEGDKRNEWSSDDVDEAHKTIQILVERDEPKSVIREHHLRAWGTCPVCKVNVGLPFHIQFCGKCGTRLVWEGEKK